METKISYMRNGQEHSVNIETRLVPNPLAVKFVVIERELGRNKDLVSQDDTLCLDDLLNQMGIKIIDVSRTGMAKSVKATQPK